MKRGTPCPTCERIPVSGKTWSLLTNQDSMIKRLRERIKELEKQLKEEA